MVDAFELLFVNFLQELRKAIAHYMALQPDYSPPWKRCCFSDLPGFASKRPREAKEHRRSSHASSKDSVPVLDAEEEMTRGGERRVVGETRKRPARIVVPEFCAGWGSGEVVAKEERFEVEGSQYWLASRKGKKHVMEDGYGVVTNINGDSRQAFFGVFDGHGGRAAVDFVSEKLGKNIIAAFAELQQGDSLEHAIRAGYLGTDREFLSQGVHSGACVATVVLRDGELFAANVGDCRVVMSKKGVANALTTDHRAGRKDERMRIESSGGYVNFCNGVWRVHDSLAISRAIGDGSMKEWVISEPETKKLRLTPDCEFLIMASDGLWDKVTDQEAVDVVLRHKNSVKSCKELVDISCGRGCRDDVTVMVVDLQSFL